MTTDPGREAAARVLLLHYAFSGGRCCGCGSDKGDLFGHQAAALAAAGLLAALPGPPDEGADLRARLSEVTRERDDLARRCERQAARIARCQQLHLAPPPSCDGWMCESRHEHCPVCGVNVAGAAEAGFTHTCPSPAQSALPGQDGALVPEDGAPPAAVQRWADEHAADLYAALPGQEPAAGTERATDVPEVLIPPHGSGIGHWRKMDDPYRRAPAPGQVTAADTPPADPGCDK